jgi:hypothetical protein
VHQQTQLFSLYIAGCREKQLSQGPGLPVLQLLIVHQNGNIFAAAGQIVI